MIPLRHSPRGFTLIELMVAMTIGMVVLLTAIAMLGRGGDEYERIGGNVGSGREARAVLTQLSEDLRATSDALFENNTAVWPATRLGLFTLQSPEAQSAAGQLGDLCVVQYYLKDLTIGGKTVRCLMRGFRESKETFAALRSGQTATLLVPGERDEPLAFGVISFEARPKSRDPGGAWVDCKPDAALPPEAVEVRIILARRELAAKLTSPAAWDGGGTTARLLGTAADAAGNRNLELITAIIRFGGRVEPTTPVRR